MANKKKKGTGYKIAVFGAKGILRILTYILVGCSVFLLCKTAYSFGYSVFKQEAMAKAPGQAVTVVIPEGSSALDIGEILEKKGLVESPFMFVLQEYLSTYHGDLKAGTYLLNTSMIPDEIMAILSGVEIQEQDSDTDSKQEDVNADTAPAGNAAAAENADAPADVVVPQTEMPEDDSTVTVPEVTEE